MVDDMGLKTCGGLADPLVIIGVTGATEEADEKRCFDAGLSLPYVSLSFLPDYISTHLPSYLPSYPHIYLPTYLPT